MNEFPPLRSIPMGFSLKICCGGRLAVPPISDLSNLSGLTAFFVIPVRIHCSSKSTGSSSSELESSGKISFGSGNAGGDLMSVKRNFF